MPSIRERVSAFWDGGATARAETRRLAEAALEAYQYSTSPQYLVEQLQETDPELLDWLLQQRGWDAIGLVGMARFSEQDRLRAVKEARHMYYYDVQTKRAVNMWTDFGLGQRIEIVPRDEVALPVWEEFWTARRNRPVLGQRHVQDLSNKLVLEGELFLVFYGSTLDGKSTVRRVVTDEIVEVITVPGDRETPLYYVRQTEATSGQEYNQIYYPDWQATQAQLRKVEIPRNAILAQRVKQTFLIDKKTVPSTRVVMLHAAYDVGDKGRGWPMFRQAMVWSRTYKNFLGDRATIAKVVAMFVNEIIHKGGSRAGKAIAAKFASTLSATSSRDTNPPAATGSMLVHDEAVDVRRMPLGTGAGDARIDGMTLLGQVSAGTGIPLHWLGRPDAMQNRATARETERPWLEQMERYQTWWADVFNDIVEIVLRLSGTEYEDYSADVTLDSPYYVTTDEIARLFGAVTDAQAAGILPAAVATATMERLLAVGLTNIGIRDASDIIEQALEEEPEEEAPPPTPPEEEEMPGEDVTAAVAQAVENYRSGAVDADDVFQFLLTELLERD